MENARIEALAQILDYYNLIASDEQVKSIVNDFSLHLEMESEMENYGHVDRNSRCDKCEQLQKQLEVSNRDTETYRQFIKDEKGADWVGISNGIVKGTYS